jgi:predicted enzyme related to lactoylglutathione lyase
MRRPEGGRLHMPPTTFANGKICYIGIPADDIQRSSEFYGKVFGWQIRTRKDGQPAFDDSIGEVSGTWVRGRSPVADNSLLFYVMVNSVAETLHEVVANGGKVVRQIGVDLPEITVRIQDPAGNVLGLYQEPSGFSPGA